VEVFANGRLLFVGLVIRSFQHKMFGEGVSGLLMSGCFLPRNGPRGLQHFLTRGHQPLCGPVLTYVIISTNILFASIRFFALLPYLL
jgi:hypothetical protein